jgi:hypothetical protein
LAVVVFVVPCCLMAGRSLVLCIPSSLSQNNFPEFYSDFSLFCVSLYFGVFELLAWNGWMGVE